MKKFVCPYCGNTHSLCTCDVKCSYDSPLGTKCVRGVVRDADGRIPDGRKAYCMRCKHARKSVFCPELGKELPMRCLTSTVLPIVLVGAKESGKSSYLAAAIRELRRKSAAFSFGIDTNAVGETAAVYDRDYGSPLDENRTLDATNPCRELSPLIYPISFGKARREAVISFYDTAGNDLCSEEHIKIKNRCLSVAGGILFLIDPLQINSVRQRLCGKVALPPKSDDACRVLESVVSLIYRFNNQKPGKLIDIPIAVTFTKLDLLISHGIIDRNGSAAGDGMHEARGAFVRSDADEVRRELSALAEEYFSDEMLAYLSCFRHKEMFAVSALGSDPVNGRLTAPVAPKRVLDPLLWIFAEKGFVKKVK